jgi:Fe-S cluster biogenesis protein NfuA
MPAGERDATKGGLMAAGHDAQKAGERVEALLAELGTQAGPQVAATAEELVSCLVELYGAGLAEMVRIIGEDAEAGQRLMARLAGDPLVESLLLLHELHPMPIAERVRRAIDQVMPQLGAHAGTAEFAGLDETGAVRIRLELTDHGRQAHAAAVQEALEQAVADAAPEASGVRFDVVAAAAELPLLQITRRPAGAR